MKELKIGISGHRQIANPDLLRKKIESELVALIDQNKPDKLIALTALATGADTLFAEIAHEVFGAELRIVLPMDPAQYRHDFSDVDLVEFDKWMTLAHKKGTIEIAANSVGPNFSRNEKYHACGKFIVDHSDIMLFAWDGQESSGLGGTADVVDYAIQIEREHRIMETYRSKINQARVEQDQKAEKIKKSYHKLWGMGISFSLLSAFLFTLNVTFIKKASVYLEDTSYEMLTKYLMVIITSIELLLILSVIGIIRHFKTKKPKEAYLRHRRNAERLRLVEWLATLGFQEPELEDISKDDFQDDVLSLIQQSKSKHLAKPSLNDQIILIQDMCDEQLQYHETRTHRIERKHEKIEKLLLFVLIAFVAAVVGHLAVEITHLHPKSSAHETSNSYSKFIEILPVFLCMFLPMLYASLEARSFFNEWAKHIQDSKHMIEFFTVMKSNLKAIALQSDHADAQIQNIVDRIYVKMDEENSGWKRSLIIKEGPGI